jgi:hypothetical protein
LRTKSFNTRKNMASVISITSEQKIPVVLSPKTAAENPAQVENPVWTKISGDATLEVSEDGLSATLISGEPGISEFAVVADADLGEGIVEIGETITLAVTTPLAASLGITVGTPEPK